MDDRLNSLLLVCAVAGASLLGASVVPGRPHKQAQEAVTASQNGTAPADAPLLNPAEFREDANAFVAYTIAAEVEETLGQVPCYCPCVQIGHQSLRDCFRTVHGALCLLCQKEAVYCYLQRKKGKSTAQIRAGLANGRAAKLGLANQMKRLYQQLQKSQR